MNQIRLRYTGFVAYFSSITLALTGLLFSLLITRKLTPIELGVWRYLGTLISYFAMPIYLFSFWSTRLTAQNKYILKTLLTITIPLAFFIMLIFMAMIEIFSSSIEYPEVVFLVAAFEIPLIYIYTSLESVATAWRPHLNYYAQIIQDLIKLPIALILVVSLKLSLTGAILATISGFIARSLFLYVSLQRLNWGGVDKTIAKKFFALVWLPLYISIPTYISSLDVIIITLLAKSAYPLGYATALFLIGGFVSMSGNLAAGLYPKMLQKPSGKDVESVLSLIMMFVIPTAIGTFILKEQLLNILRPEYVAAASLLPIALLHSVIFILNSIMDSTLLGEERVDYKDEIRFKEIINSKLFFVPTLNYLYSFMYLPSLLIALYIIQPKNPLDIVMIWITTNLIALFIITAYKYRIASRKLQFSFPKIPTIKYFLASIFMGIIVYSISPRSLPSELYKALQSAIPSILIGSLSYFGMLTLVDKEFRSILKAALKFRK
ncbi:MAG: polysaccharide biosynthesis C-terminal domain-containing protein [Candidatus Bathyarchaeia archaeon]